MLFALSYPLSNKSSPSPCYPYSWHCKHTLPFASFYFSHPLVAGSSIRQVPAVPHMEKAFIHLAFTLPFSGLVWGLVGKKSQTAGPWGRSPELMKPL